MDKTKFFSTAMVDEEITKLVSRKAEIQKEVATKQGDFSNADVDKRELLIKDVETLQNEDKQIDTDINELNELRSQLEEQERRFGLVSNFSSKAIERRAKTNDPYDTPEYRKAWKNYVITGNDKEVRALATSTENVPIPTLMQGYIETSWEKFGKFSRLVAKTFYAGYLAIPYELSATPAVVHTEGSAAPAEEEITFGQIELKPAMIKKWISLTDELVALTPEDFMRYIADELIYRVVLVLDEGIINSALDTNGKGVVGIIGNKLSIDVTKELDFNSVNVALSRLNVFDDIVVAMNQVTFFDNLMGLVDTQGRPIFQVMTDNEGKPRYYMNGHRVEFTNAIKAYDDVAAGEPWAVVGDFSRGYRLNLPEGGEVRTLPDPYTLATDDKVRLIGKLFAAGNVVKQKHFAVLRKPE